jgi:geranylgeranyl pyrophosphate synthase
MALGEAHDFAEMAIHQIEPLPECNEKSSLIDLATYITTRRV